MFLSSCLSIRENKLHELSRQRVAAFERDWREARTWVIALLKLMKRKLHCTQSGFTLLFSFVDLAKEKSVAERRSKIKSGRWRTSTDSATNCKTLKLKSPLAIVSPRSWPGKSKES